MADELTPKQEQFCLEYCKDLNATKAAIRAGYSPKSAAEQAYDFLRKPQIQNRLKALIGQRSARVQISADEVLLALKKMAFFNMADLYDEKGNLKDIKDIPEDARLAINGVETFVEIGEGVQIGHTKKVKMSERIKAMELLGRHLAIWNDKLDMTINPLEKKTMEELLKRRNELRKKNK